jgi:hypothetical protein
MTIVITACTSQKSCDALIHRKVIEIRQRGKSLPGTAQTLSYRSTICSEVRRSDHIQHVWSESHLGCLRHHKQSINIIAPFSSQRKTHSLHSSKNVFLPVIWTALFRAIWLCCDTLFGSVLWQSNTVLDSKKNHALQEERLIHFTALEIFSFLLYEPLCSGEF